jgi:hypothetical protein
VTTFTDGTSPSVNPEPDDGSGPRGARDDARRDDADVTDTGPVWLRDEIQRRISGGRPAGSAGRHARRGTPAPSTGSHVPRHSVATPGPGAPRPGPVGGHVSQASELLRRERAAVDRLTWSGPAGEGPGAAAASAPGGLTAPSGAPAGAGTGAAPVPPGEPTPNAAARAPDVPAGDPHATAVTRRLLRPGVAAAAAMRGAALGRGRTKAARTTGTPAATGPPAPAAGTTPVPGEEAAAPGALPRPDTPPDPGEPTDVIPAVPDAPATGTDEATNAPTAGTAAVDPAAAETGPSPMSSVPPAQPPAWASPTDRLHPVTPPPAAADDPAGTAGNPQVDPLPRGIVVPAQRSGEDARSAGGSRPDVPEDDIARKRVRVVLAERKSVAHPVRTVVDVQEGTGVGALLRANLIGSQLAVALRFAVGAGLTLGLLPLLFAMVPEIGRIEVLGLRLPWLLLGFLVYPFLFGLGLWHARTAERVEQNFADHVQD